MAYTRLSDANEITARYMDSILIGERLIDSVKADISVTFLGERFDMPVNDRLSFAIGKIEQLLQNVVF